MPAFVISNLPEIAMFALPGGQPNPAVPQILTSKLVTAVRSNLQVLIAKGDRIWLAVLPPRKEDKGLAMAYIYQQDEGGEWTEEPAALDIDLNCHMLFGTLIENLHALEDISIRIREWMTTGK